MSNAVQHKLPFPSSVVNTGHSSLVCEQKSVSDSHKTDEDELELIPEVKLATSPSPHK